MDDFKKALVTGGSRGVGRGILLSLAKAGYMVAFSYNSEEKEAQELASKIEKLYGKKAFYYQASLQKKGVAQQLVTQAIQDMQGLDLLVNNAGVTALGSILDIDFQNTETLIDLDFKSYLVATQAAAQYMVKNKIKGSIINITSTRASRAYPEDAVYGGVKAAIERATQSIALDLAPYGVRINCIAPGAIQVRTNKELLEKKDFPVPVNFWEELGERIPLGRVGTPSDIGNAAVFLASEEASYITGTTLRVDGGLILPGMPEVPKDERKGWL